MIYLICPSCARVGTFSVLLERGGSPSVEIRRAVPFGEVVDVEALHAAFLKHSGYLLCLGRHLHLLAGEYKIARRLGVGSLAIIVAD